MKIHFKTILGAEGEGDDRGWDDWMASLTWWTWVWVNSGSWWWTGRPGMLRFMGSQRVGHGWATELMGLDAMILVFRMLIVNSTFLLSSFTFIRRLFSSLLSAIRVVSSAYLKLLIFLPAILTQDGQVMVESSDKTWSTWEGNGKPLQ